MLRGAGISAHSLRGAGQALGERVCTGFLPSRGSGERVGALAQDGEIASATEHTAPFAARDFFDDTKPFQIGERRIDRGS